jgi:hypothetical protein
VSSKVFRLASHSVSHCAVVGIMVRSRPRYSIRRTCSTVGRGLAGTQRRLDEVADRGKLLGVVRVRDGNRLPDPFEFGGGVGLAVEPAAP